MTDKPQTTNLDQPIGGDPQTEAPADFRSATAIGCVVVCVGSAMVGSPGRVAEIDGGYFGESVQ